MSSASTDDVVIVASKGGMSHHPLWYRNLQANPEVEVQIGKQKRAMLARTATDDEKTALWVIPVDGGEARKVVAHDEDVSGYSWSPDGQRVAFLGKEKEEEIKRRRQHYEEVRLQLEKERERILKYLLPRRYAMSGSAQVFPVCVEVRLPVGSS